MAGGLITRENGQYVEVFCEHSKNEQCTACKSLPITCDGAKYWMCEQRRLTKEKDEMTPLEG